MAEFTTKPAKMQLVSVENPARRITAQFNPTEVKESLKPVWNSLQVQGLSHTRDHYSHTESLGVSLDLSFNADSLDFTVEDIEKARRFLHAMCYTSNAENSSAAGRPSRVLFIWPKVMALTTKLQDVQITWEAFNLQGQITRMTARLAFSEIRDVRLTAEDVFSKGTVRSDVPYQG